MKQKSRTVGGKLTLVVRVGEGMGVGDRVGVGVGVGVSELLHSVPQYIIRITNNSCISLH